VAGNLSLLYIGQQVYSAVNLIMTKAISAPSCRDWRLRPRLPTGKTFRRIYRHRVLWTLAATAAATLALVAVGEPLLRQMIGHGGITGKNVHQLWLILVALSGVLIGGTSGQVISSAFYAIGDTRTPTMLFIVTYTIYIPIKIVVFLKYGMLGLAAVTSVHLSVNFLLQLVVLERTLGATATMVEAG
jgi:peptidoglycan biosynthesis protein MviN/MurJ (putative lipid II flippase)